MSQYTHIPVMYRDGANYKSYGIIVLDGLLTPEQARELSSYLSGDLDSPQFKPEVLGMEHHAYGEGGYNDEWDHPWHDLLLGEMFHSDTDDTGGHYKYPEHPGTVEQFIAAVKVAHDNGWEAE